MSRIAFRLRRFLGISLLVMLASIGSWARGRAASQAQAVLWQVAPVAYPHIAAYVSVYGPDGFFIPDLNADHFTVTEAEQTRPVKEAQVQHPGLSITVAINPGRAFALHDARGVARQLYIFYQLQSWLEKEQRGHHDLSLLTLDGPTLLHTDDPLALLDAITDYFAKEGQTFRQKTPELTPLVHAITQAATPTPRVGMGRVVLFITAPLDDLKPEDLDLPRARAREAHVRIWIWLVGHPDLANTLQGRLWAQLAADTGGQFLIFSGQEVLPDLKSSFERLDGAYRLIYTTAQTEPGTYPVRVTVDTPYGQLHTQETRLDLHLDPPQVRWLVLPEDITRRPAEPGQPPNMWPPTEQRLEVAVTFPDGINRPLRRSALWVDGEKIAEHMEPPFERFMWDLSGYTTTETHSLQIEIEDVLGLTGASPEVQVTVRVVQPTPAAGTPSPMAPQAATPALPSSGGTTPDSGTSFWENPIVWGSALVAGLVLLAALWSAWRGKGLRPKRAARPARSASPHTPQAWGVLEPLPPLEPDWPPPPQVTLREPEVVLGSDPAQAQVVLEDRSVSPRHARVWRDDAGQVFIADLRSLAGTWVNYAPVSAQGVPLEPGDVVYIGRLGFRFVQPEEGGAV